MNNIHFKINIYLKDTFMNVDGWKIKKLIEVYGINNDIPAKSYLPRFCEENNLNYIQWNAYTRNTQTLGIKIVYLLIDIFPNLNLNWLLKDETNMFIDEVGAEHQMVSDKEAPAYKKEVSNLDIMLKLKEIQNDINKKLKSQ